MALDSDRMLGSCRAPGPASSSAEGAEAELLLAVVGCERRLPATRGFLATRGASESELESLSLEESEPLEELASELDPEALRLRGATGGSIFPTGLSLSSEEESESDSDSVGLVAADGAEDLVSPSESESEEVELDPELESESDSEADSALESGNATSSGLALSDLATAAPVSVNPPISMSDSSSEELSESSESLDDTSSSCFFVFALAAPLAARSSRATHFISGWRPCHSLNTSTSLGYLADALVHEQGLVFPLICSRFWVSI